MEYLKIRRGTGQKRKDGSQYAVPLFVKKTRKYGETLSEETISRKKSILVIGPHDSGKTRWAQRLHQNEKEIWGAKIPAAPLYLSALTPLSAWVDGSSVGDWWDEQLKKADPDKKIANPGPSCEPGKKSISCPTTLPKPAP